MNVVRLKTSKNSKREAVRKSTRMTDAQRRGIERYARIIIAAVTHSFPASSFTRDDILTLVSRMRIDNDDEWAEGAYGVNDVSTGTRYRKVCVAVNYLVVRKQLMALDWLRLCLPVMFADLAAEVPPQVLYLPTVRRIVTSSFKANTVLDAMMVVRKWQSDQHVPENVKRMVVRGVFPMLNREKILRRDDDNRFIVRDLTTKS